MRPLIEQLKKLEGIPVPDFGPLDDWAANRNAEMQHRARRAAGMQPTTLPILLTAIFLKACPLLGRPAQSALNKQDLNRAHS